MSKFTVYTDKHNEFRWKFHANNDSVVARSSEGFKRKEECLSSVSLLQKDIAGSTVVQDVLVAPQQKAAAPIPSPVVAIDVKAVVPTPALATPTTDPVAASLASKV